MAFPASWSTTDPSPAGIDLMAPSPDASPFATQPTVSLFKPVSASGATDCDRKVMNEQPSASTGTMPITVSGVPTTEHILGSSGAGGYLVSVWFAGTTRCFGTEAGPFAGGQWDPALVSRVFTSLQYTSG